MVCPYCGQEIVVPNKEHYFPQSVYYNDWDFYVCRECNKLKGQHIVYPSAEVFKVLPTEFSIEKFRHLWTIASWDKYLSIVPAAIMRKIFNERKWHYGSYMFTLEERLFYNLDPLKKMYEFADRFIQENPNCLALVASPITRRIYLIHTYSYEFPVIYPEIKSMNVDKFVDMRVKGWLVLGSAKCGIWRNTVNYKEYFRTLFSAPSGLEML